MRQARGVMEGDWRKAVRLLAVDEGAGLKNRDRSFFIITFMKPAVGLLIAMLFFEGVPNALAQRGNPRVGLEGQSIDQMIAAFMEEHRIPGMTLAIVQAPYISRVIGYGTANTEKGLLASPKTLWNIGAMGQGYTAVAMMQLVEADKIGLDDPIGKHLPELPAPWHPITVRQLMGHLSGLPDYTRQPGFKPEQEYRIGEMLELVSKAPLAFRPGTQVAESATDIFLLARLVEKASGTDYEEFITRNQIERLGLKNTLFPSRLSQVRQEAVEKNALKHKEFLRERAYIDPAEVAVGNVEVEGKLAPVKGSARAWTGQGEILASAEDISLWDIGLAGELLIKKKEHRDFLYHPVKLADGETVPAHCGWRFPRHKGLMDIKGNAPGFSCYLSRFTDKSELLCVTLCANRDGVDLSGLARRIAGAFDPKLGPPANPETMTCVESCFSVSATMDRLERFLKSKGVDIISRIDHSAAAKNKGLQLRPTEVLIFGNPAVGTHLLSARGTVALDLPLRVAVWEDPDGSVWLGYHDVQSLAEDHGVTNQAALVNSMRKGLSAAVLHASAPY